MIRKLFAMDLDGTAVADDYSLPFSAVEAIMDARDKGIVTAFVSGRRDVDMLTMGEEQYCVDYHILNNGGKIIRCKDKEVIDNQLIARDPAIKLLQYALTNELQLHIISGMKWQITKLNESTLAYAKLVGIIPEVIDKTEEVDLDHIEGFMATKDLKPIAEYIDNHLPELSYVHSEPGTIDIMAAGVSKINGIFRLADILKIGKEDIVTAGNYYNDIEMIEKAGTGIAVANAVDELKQIADYVTVNDNNHDAVKEMLEFILKGNDL